MNPHRKGQAGNPVSTGMQASTVTPFANTSFILPHGLRLQQKVGQATITNVTASGGTITYTAANNYSAGNAVSIYNVNPVAYNLQGVTIASASSTQFTITNAATGTYVSGGTVQRTGEIDVTIPAGITFVYAICVGGGGVGFNLGGGSGSRGGGGGGIAYGWTLATSTCIVGPGARTTASSGGYTRYGSVIAGGGAGGSAGVLGSGGAGPSAGGTSYWGVPGGVAGTSGGGNGGIGWGGGGAGSGTSGGLGGMIGGHGVSGGGGGSGGGGTGGNGGSGFVGGGGGNNGGAGGSGRSLIENIIYTGGYGAIGIPGGGGAGVQGNGADAAAGLSGHGGLGGGGGGGGSIGTRYGGGNGVIYLFY